MSGMKGWELGHVFSFLMENRALRSFAAAGQRLKPQEAEYAKFWAYGATERERAFMDDFLQSQGFKVKRYDSFDMPAGIPEGQFVYLLLRDGTGSLSTWANSEQAVERVRCKYENKPEPKDHARIWLALLWFSMLHLLYARIGRGVSEVSRYQEARFSKDELADIVRETIENQRKLEVEEPSFVREAILSNGDPKIPNRVKAFTAYLIEINNLVEIEPGVCQQTLLSAAEMGVNFEDGLNLLYPEEAASDPEGREDNPIEPMQRVEEAFTLANNSEIGTETEF